MPRLRFVSFSCLTAFFCLALVALPAYSQTAPAAAESAPPAASETNETAPPPAEQTTEAAGSESAETAPAASAAEEIAEPAAGTISKSSETEAAAAETAEPAPPVAEDAAPAEQTLQLTPATIREAMASLDAETELDESQSAAVKEVYATALALLEKAARFETACKDYSAAIEAAPARLTELQTQREAMLASAATPAPLPEDEAQLEQLKQTLTTDITTAEQSVAKLETDRGLREEHRTTYPTRREELRKRLSEIEGELAITQATTPAGRAQRMKLLAEQRAASAEIQVIDLELQSYTATTEAVAVAEELARKKLEALRAQLERVVREINHRRTVEAERRAAEARHVQAAAHPRLRELADLNVELAERNVEITELTSQTYALTMGSKEESLRLDVNLRRLNDRLAHTDRSETIGRMLHEYRQQLPDLRELQQAERERKRTLDAVFLEQFELEESLASWESKDEFAGRVLAEMSLHEEERTEMQATIAAMVTRRNDNAGLLIHALTYYKSSLAELEKAENDLEVKTGEFEEFIAKNSLWVADLKPLGGGDLAAIRNSAGQIFSWNNWSTAFELALLDVIKRPLYWLAMACGLAALFTFGAKQRRQLSLLGKRVEAGLFDTSFVVTLRAIALTAAIAAPGPLLLVFLGWRIGLASTVENWPSALGAGLMTAAVYYYLLEFLRHACRPGGLAEAHFDWPCPDLVRIRQRLGWPMILGLPLVLVVASTASAGYAPETASLGRVAFLLCTTVLAASLPMLAMPAGNVVAAAFGHPQRVWRRRWQFMLGSFAGGAPAVLVILAAVGYYYTAVQLGWRLAATAAVGVGVLLVHATLVRALLVARKQRATEEASQQNVDTATSRPGSRPKVAMFDPVVSRVEVRQVVRKLTIVAGLAAAWAIWAHVLPALHGLEKPTIMIGDVSVSYWKLILASLLAVVAFLASRNLPELLEVTVLQRMPLDAGGRYAMATLIRYGLTAGGVWWVFSLLGFEWSQFQWLFAAMSLGLGFGLQEVFANFVCGLIILFERPIRVGDIVTVGDMQGKVARIRIRATTILDWDHRELLVPNKEFITNRLVNWTLSDPVTRVVIPVGIAYGSDTGLARRLLMKVARENPLVMTAPAPSALFLGFGDSSLNFELRVFLPDRNYWADLIDNLHSRIDEEFRAAGIEIAFPQCDIHLRTIDGVLATRQVEHSGSGQQDDVDEASNEVPASPAALKHNRKDAA